MSELHSQIARLKRPRLLIRAARIGLADYRRTRLLRALLADTRTTEDVVARLLEHEARAEAQRRGGEASYSVARHVEILIALMAEARHLPVRAQARESGKPRRPAPPPGTSAPCRPDPAASRHPEDAGRGSARWPRARGACIATPDSSVSVTAPSNGVHGAIEGVSSPPQTCPASPCIEVCATQSRYSRIKPSDKPYQNK